MNQDTCRSKNKRKALTEVTVTWRQEMCGASACQQWQQSLHLYKQHWWPWTDNACTQQSSAVQVAMGSEVLQLLWTRSGMYNAEFGPGSSDMIPTRWNTNQHKASLVSGEPHGDCAFPKAPHYYPFAFPWGIRMADVTKATTAQKQQGEQRFWEFYIFRLMLIF